MEWTNETVLRFLELYRSHPCIWNPKDVTYKDKTQHNEAWVDIKNQLGGQYPVKELKRKKDSLMAAYRTYRTKIKKLELSRPDASNFYMPTWFAYSYMDEFLGSVYQCKLSTNTENDLHVFKKEYCNNAYDTKDIYVSDIEKEPAPASSKHRYGKLKRSKFKPGDTQQNKTAETQQYKPIDLQEAKEQMDQAYQILKSVSLVSRQEHNDKDDDECYIFGKLIAKKMRKLPEDRRDLMMIKINQLFYNEFYED